ncbi:MAG: CinA family protein, partial [Deltaproteobacteria bacterium]|nr:CinA family protein [Deltaproteobacteria bacterium]
MTQPYITHTVRSKIADNAVFQDESAISNPAKAGFEEEIGRLLKDKRLSLAIGESCTGGLIGHRITNVPGSSAYFKGGIIAYSNELKMGILHVSPDTLQAKGAVSEETALEMAKGVRDITGADIGLAVTGIAGPEGGSREKPAGTVFIALYGSEKGMCKRFYLEGDRTEVKTGASQKALEMLRDYLLET